MAFVAVIKGQSRHHVRRNPQEAYSILSSWIKSEKRCQPRSQTRERKVHRMNRNREIDLHRQMDDLNLRWHRRFLGEQLLGACLRHALRADTYGSIARDTACKSMA